MRWRRGPERAAVESLRRGIDRLLVQRGTATLELRSLTLDATAVQVEFYSRPPAIDGRLTLYGTGAAAFADQVFRDAVNVLEAIWRQVDDVQVVRLSAWAKAEGLGGERRLLSTQVDRTRAHWVLAGTALPAADVLRRFPTQSCIDRQGNLHPEQLLK